MKQINTRVLMTCAAIGVAGGLLFTAHAWLGVLTTHTVPFIYGITIGTVFLPGAVAQALFQRPGIGLLTTLLAGLIASPLQPIFFMATIISLMIGVAQEIVFALTRYRRWGKWMFFFSGLVCAIVSTGAAFGILKGADYTELCRTLVVACFAVSPLPFTLLGRSVAQALERAGIVRGLQTYQPANNSQQNPNNDNRPASMP